MATRGPQQECHLSPFLFALSRQRDTRAGQGPSGNLGRAHTWVNSIFSCCFRTNSSPSVVALDSAHSGLMCRGWHLLAWQPPRLQNCSEESYPQCSAWGLTQRGFEGMGDPLKGTCWNTSSVWNPWGGAATPHLPWQIPELLKLRWVGEEDLCPRWPPPRAAGPRPVLPLSPQA